MKFFTQYFAGYNKPGGIRELLMLAFPMIISTACDGIMTFTDRLFLARVGPEQMNAAMGGYVSLQTLMFFFVGLTGYTTALAAQYFGAGQKPNSSKAAFQAILVTLLAWPIIIMAKPLATHLFSSAGISATQVGYQTVYLSILVNFSIFSLMRYTLGCYFTGIGKTRIVMVATIVAMVVNVLLDYIFIFGHMGFAPMGVSGAAYATSAGSICATIVLLVTYFSKTNRIEFKIIESLRFNWDIMKRLLKYGYPAGLEMFFNFLAFSAMVVLFHSRGDAEATAATIMFNWDMVSFIPLLGIEIAVTSLVGRYMGAGRPQVAHRAALSGIRTGLFYSAVILILFVFIPKTLVMVFKPDNYSHIFNTAVPMAVKMVQFAAIYVMAEAVMVAVIGALRGAGDTFFTMIISVSAHWCFLPVVYVMLNIFNLSVPFAWLAIVILFMVFSLVLIMRFANGKWKKIKVISAT